MSKTPEEWEQRFLVYKKNVYPIVIESLAEQLNVSKDVINRLEIGYHPGEQAWVFAERNDKGQIVGLLKRYWDGKKFMEEGSNRGLIYECNGVVKKRSSISTKRKFIRAYSAGVDCPLCGKRDWCLLSNDDVQKPSAVICGRTEKGAIKFIEGSGYLHRLRGIGDSRQTSILPVSNKPIIVVEGATDVLVAMQMGYVAIGKPAAESGHIFLAPLLKDKDVIVIGENDETGRRGMHKTFQVLRANCTSVKKILPPVKYKDLRDWHPTADEFEQWVKEQAEEAEQNNIVESIDYWGLAEQWLKDSKHILCRYQGDWYKYDGVCYREVTKEWLEKQLREYFRNFEVTVYRSKTKSIMPLIVDKKFVEEIRLTLQSICYIEVPRGIQEPFYIGKKANLDLTYSVVFRNGIYHLFENKLEPLTSEIFVTSTLPYDYDVNARCPLWLWFSADIFNGDDESINLLQEWFGYNLIASNHMEQMMFLFGVTGSGKSTTSDVLQALIGEDRCTAVALDDFSYHFGLQALIGKYTAIISEGQAVKSRQTQKALEQIKQITGQDLVNINRKYKESINAKLFCRITYVGNELPNFNDEPQALFRRFNLLYFGNNYCGPGRKPDRTLKHRLIKEAPGIAQWALEGLRRLLENKEFTLVEISKKHIEACKAIASPLKTGIEEWCKFGEKEHVSCNTLFDLCKAIFEEEGLKPMSRSWFGIRLRNAYPELKRVQKFIMGKRVYEYEGISIISEAYERYLGRPK